MKKVIAFILSAICLTSCANFHGTDTSIWADGVWMIPWSTGILSVFSWVQLYRSWKSGSKRQDQTPGSPTRGQWIPVPGKTASKWFLFLSIALPIVTIVVIIVQYGER